MYVWFPLVFFQHSSFAFLDSVSSKSIVISCWHVSLKGRGCSVRWWDFISTCFSSFFFQHPPSDSSENTALAGSTWECHFRDGSPCFPFWERRESLRWCSFFSSGFINKSQTCSDHLSSFPFLFFILGHPPLISSGLAESLLHIQKPK